MSTITQNSPLFTLINVFSVAPERQQELVDLLVDTTEQIVRLLPGFVSANIHKSMDGVRVINYAQWESKAAFEAFLHNPTANAHFKVAEEIADNIDYHTYAVAQVISSSAALSSIPD